MGVCVTASELLFFFVVGGYNYDDALRHFLSEPLQSEYGYGITVLIASK